MPDFWEYQRAVTHGEMMAKLFAAYLLGVLFGVGGALLTWRREQP